MDEYVVDRTGWSAGPWDDEPDKVVWVDPATDLDCMAVRNHYGAWCGYVGLPPGHRFHGSDYDTVNGEGIDAHGSLTYSDACGGHICHVPQPGRPEDVWWLGFDCNHSFDLAPAMQELLSDITLRYGGEYRDLDYVKAECARLAGQLAGDADR